MSRVYKSGMANAHTYQRIEIGDLEQAQKTTAFVARAEQIDSLCVKINKRTGMQSFPESEILYSESINRLLTSHSVRVQRMCCPSRHIAVTKL